MINGAHVILYSTDAEADRVFIRDVLGFAGVDAGGGWLIFKLPPAEVAVHPTDGPGKHELYLMCDDIDKTLSELTAKGITISQGVSDRGWAYGTKTTSVTMKSSMFVARTMISETGIYGVRSLPRV